MHPPFQWSVTTDGVLLQKGNRHYSALKPVTLHWIDGHHKRQTLFKNYDNYRLIDLNKDGVKELILYKQPEGIVFFTYYKGKVTPLIYDYWLRGVYLKGNYLTIQQGTSSENTCRVYILKNGKFKQIGEYFHTTSSAYPVPVYKINGKSCSKETFFKTYNKYMKNMKDLI